MWFLNLYRELAEPLPNEKTAEGNSAYELITVEAEHPLFSLTVGLCGYAPKKYLTQGRFEDLFALHMIEKGHDAISRSTLRNCFKQRWEKYLRWRNAGQGKRCKVCAELDEMRSKASTNEEKLEYQQAKAQHVQEIKFDREVLSRSTRLAIEAARKPSIDGYQQILKVVVDGMDQAKFKCPRNLKSNAELCDLWRPALHVTGIIVHGWLEMYCIMPPDVPKDANMECTVVARALDVVWEKFFEGGNYKLPRSMEVNTDNTTREGVNNTFATFLAMLPAMRKFEDTKSARLVKDHTHNELDQRFSSLATCLSQAGCLEDEGEFRDHILENFKPAGGRHLHVEVLRNTFDFQSWFESLGIHFKGICPTQGEPRVTHVWHFVQRGLSSRLLPPGMVIENHHENHVSESMEDTLLLTKHHLHSSTLSQTPVLAVPQSSTHKLRTEDLMVF